VRPYNWRAAVSGKSTNVDLGASFSKMEEETAEFVREQGLQESILWLIAGAPSFFRGANFQVDLMHDAESGEDLLALKVFGEFPMTVFRRQRHLMHQAMTEAGHKKLSSLLGIFQRRIHNSGRQGFSGYGSPAAE